jgi:uncharacterized pyridoxamine 5'-phosphate oxidase family protein
MTTLVTKQINSNDETTIMTIEDDTIHVRYSGGIFVVTLAELEKALELHQSKILSINN